jgi:hypothetical protein
MAIYPLQQIPIAPAAERLLIKNTQSNQTSQYSGKQTVIQYYGSWTLEASYPRMGVGEAEVLASWLDQLQGAVGSFKWTPSNGTATVPVELSLSSAAFAGSNTVSIGGFAAGGNTYLRTGNYIQIGTQLFRVAGIPLKADSSGNAVAEFYPGLRSDFPVNTPVITDAPCGVFRLSSDFAGSGYQIDPDWVPEFDKITAVEVI